MTAPPLPALADVEAAALRLRGVVRRTPLLESDALNELVGGRLLCKAECLQRTGSFKLRGAYNTISQLAGQPVVAWSSGNHAQGVAAAARLLGVPATIVMPADAPAIKIANTRALGAKIRLYDRQREVREEIGAEIALRTGAAVVRPYDDPENHRRPRHRRAGGGGAVARAGGRAGCGRASLRRRRPDRRLQHRTCRRLSRGGDLRRRAARLRRHRALVGCWRKGG